MKFTLYEIHAFFTLFWRNSCIFQKHVILKSCLFEKFTFFQKTPTFMKFTSYEIHAFFTLSGEIHAFWGNSCTF